MFDVGFWELVLIGLVALLVFGPERLPRLVRETGLWVRKARNVVSSAKTEIDRELQLFELKQTMEEKRQQFMSEMQSIEVPRALSADKSSSPLVDSIESESTHDDK